jgi:outer membrane protein assembly factor BamB
LETCPKCGGVPVSAGSLVYCPADKEFIAVSSGERAESWCFTSKEGVARLAISEDGTLAVAGSPDHFVYAFDRAGKLLWTHAADDAVTGVAISADGGLIVAGSKDGKLALLDREGNQLWAREVGDGLTCVAISSDGAVIAGGTGVRKRALIVFDAGGNPLWTRDAGDQVGGVAVSRGGGLVVAGMGVLTKTVGAFDETGKLLWNRAAGARINAVAVSADGATIAVGTRKVAGRSQEKNLLILDAKGVSQWSQSLGESVECVTLAGGGGFLAVGSTAAAAGDPADASVYLFTTSGRMVWSRSVASASAGVAVSADGTVVVVATSDKRLLGFDAIASLRGRNEQLRRAQGAERALQFAEAARAFGELGLAEEKRRVVSAWARELERRGELPAAALRFEEAEQWEDAGRVRTLALEHEGLARGTTDGPLGSAAERPPPARPYLIEGLLAVYKDGRPLYSKTDISEVKVEDPALVSGMFQSVQAFISESFQAEGELNRLVAGENQIVVERGAYMFLAAIVFGEPDPELAVAMRAAIERTESALTGVIEQWDGAVHTVSGIEEFLKPLTQMTAGITRDDVKRTAHSREVKITSQTEFFQGYLRLKVAVKNDTESVVTDAVFDLHHNKNVLRLHKVEPAGYETAGARVVLGNLNAGEKSSLAYYFDPQICAETNLDGVVSFRDARGTLCSLTMKSRKAEIVCPLFFTKEQASAGMLRRLVEQELPERDSKVYSIAARRDTFRFEDIHALCKEVVLAHDIRVVREFVDRSPYRSELWCYGETKAKGWKMVIRAAVDSDPGLVEFFTAGPDMKPVAGLLAEFNRTLVGLASERSQVGMLEPIFDESIKRRVQLKVNLNRLGASGGPDSTS